MNLQHWYELAGIILAVPVALALVWAIFKGTRHLGLVHEAIVGREKTAWEDGKPSMIERFESVDSRFDAVQLHLENQDRQIAEVAREFSTNGGKTVKDDLAALRKQIEAK